MKPLILTMRAFGSYNKETTIDFSRLSQNLFLVTGDTGAGKTTVFDAIVFAIYGEASSVANRKEGIVLQSQYAALDVTPFVRLTFSDGENGEIYVVSRTPRHRKLLKRGKGSGVRTTEKNASVSLIMPDGSEYPAKETEQKIEEIVGFNKEQFMQVAMIAQGEFMELLRAKSDVKKVIFRKLFHTDIYERIAQELERRKREKEKEIAVIKTGCRAVVHRIRIPEAYERAEQIAGLKEQIEEGVLANMGQFLEELGALCVYCAKTRGEMEKELQLASVVRDKTRDAYIGAENLVKSYGQLEQAQAELAECERYRGEMAEAAKLAADLGDAYDILTEYKVYETTNRVAESIKTAKREKEKILPGLTEREERLAEEKKKAKEQYDISQERFSKLSERVEAAKKILREMESAERGYGESLEELETAQRKEREEREKLTGLEAQEKSLKEQAEILGSAEALLERWKVKEKLALDLSEDSGEITELKKQIEVQAKRAAQTKKVYEEAKEVYLRESRSYEQRRQSFLDAQAGILAGSLEPGKPCPVCGSLEHPVPCKSGEGKEELSKEEIGRLGEMVEEYRKRQEDTAGRAKEEEISLREKRDAFEKRLRKLTEKYKEAVTGEDMSETLGESSAEIPEAVLRDMIGKFLRNVQREGVSLQKNVDDLKEIRKKLEKTGGHKEMLQQSVRQCVEKLQAAENAVHQKKGKLESLSGTVEYATVEEADRKLQEEKSRRDEAAGHFHEIQEKAEQAERERREAETLLQNYRKELPERMREAEDKRTAYEFRMRERGLDEAAWQALTATYEKEETDLLRKKVADHQLREQKAAAVKEAAFDAIGEQEKPVLEKLEAEKMQAEERLTAVKEKLAHHQEKERDNRSVYEELAPRAKERKLVIEEHTRVDQLYRLVSGNVTGGRMDLETFVQRYYLERVLHAANRRFQEMSGGQFELRMVSPERAGEGKNRGLDLMVYSAVTGKEREIRTLSGGESFMAALALALGMADQIQDSTSAVHLDMMFIDEGFGSLDEHSRNQAVKVLKEMAEGKRLIGIISHVTELKQEIEEKLIVSRNEEGSFVRWE